MYGNTFPSYLDKLTILNNKLLRILQNKGHTCCNESLYLQYNTLPPVQLFNYQVLNPRPFSSQTVLHRFHRRTQTDRRGRTHYMFSFSYFTWSMFPMFSNSYSTWRMFPFSQIPTTGENPRRGNQRSRSCVLTRGKSPGSILGLVVPL